MRALGLNNYEVQNLFPPYKNFCSIIDMIPSIAILLTSFQGEVFLNEQLRSIESQSFENWILYVSDDCSKDSTYTILNDFAKRRPGQVIITQNIVNIGFCANFLSLILNEQIQADYFAFADQDDIWKPDKLERAVNWLSTIPEDLPALYCSRTETINEQGDIIGLSPLFSRPTSFENALVQNVGGGNTMVFNQIARKTIAEASQDIDVVSHDWWLYIVVTACAGKVYYDPWPSLKYRQHAHNIIGTNNNWSSRLDRIRMMLQGRFKQWSNQHILALKPFHHRLTLESQNTLDHFEKSRKASFFRRIHGLLASKVYRQTFLGNLGLFAAVILNKI